MVGLSLVHQKWTLTAGVDLIIKVHQDNSAIGLGKQGKMTKE